MEATTCPYSQLPDEYRIPINFFVDITRNLADSRRQIDNFHLTPGVLLLHQPESLFPGQNIAALQMLADFFPNLQFILTTTSKQYQEYIGKFKAEHVPATNPTNHLRHWITTNSIRKKYIGQYRNSFRQTRFPKNQPAAEIP